MEDKCEEYDQICTDGLLKDGKVGFAIVKNNQIIKKKEDWDLKFTVQNSKRS
jgi:hypothetical protein